MHRLDRNAVPVPSCLSEASPDRRYGSLAGSEKAEIRAALQRIQGHRCAYCERRTGDTQNDGHIEHFRNQAGHRTLDLDWNNLFWSCNDEKTCGKHKDKCDRPSGTQRCFSPDELINPCVDDPEKFILFIIDGTARPCEGLSSAEQQRAEETLRVFQLAASPYLRKLREDAVRPYIGILDALRSAGPELFTTYVRSELSRLDSVPFATAIKNFLEGMISS
ncbi:retron system putative HNH endonuclease [Sorangium sp. So ce381]|uniref:retron system putative HNH endonuclease n=1 Tax=Sorangium sp. So ce381 TaxID=3133307 RepID=UPI003F5C405F